MSEVDRDRRRLIQWSVGALALPLFASEGVARAAVFGGAGERLALSAAVFDRRFPAGPVFASALEARGVQALGFAGDITPAWKGLIEPAWRGGSAVLAGLTCERNLACLVELARDYRMHVVLLARHRAVAGEGVRTRIYGPTGLRGEIAALPAAPALSWPEQAARLAMRVPAAGSRDRVGQFRSRGNGADIEAPLFSWVIAPIRPHSRSIQVPEVAI